jgi:mannitol-1-phosphate 5-dehydrogenase
VVVFGAGAIGLGLLGDILSKSNYEIKFVDVNERIISALHAYRSYQFNIVGPKPRAITVMHVDGLTYADKGVIKKAIADSEVVFTATGEDALSSIACVLAEGLIERTKRWRPLNVVCCENLHDSATLLKDHVMRRLGEFGSDIDACKVAEEVGFANTIVDKMCKSETHQTVSSYEPITKGLDATIEVEQEGELTISQAALTEPEMKLVGVKYLDSTRFEAERNKKTFAHNGGHALLAYFGALKGHDYIRESGMDAGIKSVFYRAIANEIGKALVRKYPSYFGSEQFGEYVNNIFFRMVDPYFSDTIERGMRSSIRKIGGHDARLTRAAKFSIEQGIIPYNFCLIIAAALMLNHIQAAEIEHTLLQVCGIDPNKDPELATIIARAYETLKDWQRLRFPILSLYLDQAGYYAQ